MTKTGKLWRQTNITGRGWSARKLTAGIVLAASLLFPGSGLFALETVMLALPSKSLQLVIYPLAQELGYMREEGIDLKTVFIGPTPSVQALIAGSVQFTAAGTSALIAIAKGAAALKVVLAANDRVHQWLATRPEIVNPRQLKGGRIATTGVASVATFMLKQILAKHGLDPNKDVVYIDSGTGNQLQALLAKAVDGAVLGMEQRYPAVDAGMKEMFYFGSEVKNSWGTLATTDRLIKEQPKVLLAFMRATVKALRRLRQDRETSIQAIARFSGLDRGVATRTYDDMIGTFTANGTVDDETQRNDLAIVDQIIASQGVIPIDRAYDFSFASEADRQLTQAGWRP